jgi:hypothetical protein
VSHAPSSRAAIYRPRVEIDLRGNNGGSSDVAARALGLLDSSETIERVVSAFDWTAYWRVSPRNLVELRRQNRDG